MRRIQIGTLTADLGDDGQWTSSVPRFERYVNTVSENEWQAIGPADGDPLSVLFNRVVDKLQVTRAIYTEAPNSYPADVVF